MWREKRIKDDPLFIEHIREYSRRHKRKLKLKLGADPIYREKFREAKRREKLRRNIKKNGKTTPALRFKILHRT